MTVIESQEEVSNIELQRLQLERERFEKENHHRSRELEFEREKWRHEQEKIRSWSFSPISATVLAAAVGVLGTVLGAYYRGEAELELERQKFESQLILKAVETGDREKARSNLNFFMEAGFIKDSQGKILELSKKEHRLPVLPARYSESASRLPEHSVALATDKDAYQPGETLWAVFRSDQPCYPYFFGQDEDGFIVHLMSGLEQIKPGEIFKLPLLEVTEPEGLEILLAICTTERIDFSVLNKSTDKALEFSNVWSLSAHSLVGRAITTFEVRREPLDP